MISLDTNILFYAYAADSPYHGRAAAFVADLQSARDVVVSEWTLVEFYGLLRNPAVSRKALSAAEAVEVVEVYRQHPHWGIVAWPEKAHDLHNHLWAMASHRDFARRRIFDARMALCLRGCGVTSFATANVKDFQGFGFRKVWNPLED